MKPYLTRFGTLFIPFDCPTRYRYWAGGQSILATLDELEASREVGLSMAPWLEDVAVERMDCTSGAIAFGSAIAVASSVRLESPVIRTS